MATYKAVLHHTVRADGTKRVAIRITKNRRSSYKGLEIYIEEKFFDDTKGMVRKSHNMHAVYNNLIRSRIEEFRTAEMNLESIDSFASSKDIKAEYHNNFTTDLLSFYRKYVETINLKRTKESTIRQEKYFLSKFETFLLKRPGLTLQQFNLIVLEEYQAHLLAIPNKPVTVNLHTTALATVILNAVNKGLIPHHRNPFNNFKYLSAAGEQDKYSLDIDEITRIYNYIPKPKVKKYRDIFLTQFFAHGMRISDTLNLKVSNVVGDRLNYKMMKTGKKKSILIVGRLKEILMPYIKGKQPNDFIFPILEENTLKNRSSKQQSINNYLNRMMKYIGIKKHITTHTARHSFSNILLSNTRDVTRIKEALGHSSLEITQQYLKDMVPEENDDFIVEITKD